MSTNLDSGNRGIYANHSAASVLTVRDEHATLTSTAPTSSETTPLLPGSYVNNDNDTNPQDHYTQQQLFQGAGSVLFSFKSSLESLSSQFNTYQFKTQEYIVLQTEKARIWAHGVSIHLYAKYDRKRHIFFRYVYL